MNCKSRKQQFIFSLLIVSALLMTSCIKDDALPECGLFVRFQYNYNMLSADAFSTQVNKVDLYIFDEEGLFLSSQTEEGTPLASGDYRMKISLPKGKYKIMAWAGARDSYERPVLIPGSSTIGDLTLKLKRNQSLIIDKEIDPLWYGEILELNYDGQQNRTETVNFIKDTNKIRFVFLGKTSDWKIDMNNYVFELLESNGFLDHTNSLLNDDILSYRPYYTEQKSPSAGVIELNTMRLMADRKTRFVVTNKTTGKRELDINLIDFLDMIEMEGHKWSLQEYLDRQDEYAIVFLLSNDNNGGNNENGNPWIAVQLNINGWTLYLQDEEIVLQ